MIASLAVLLLFAELSVQLKFGGRGAREWKTKHNLDSTDDDYRDPCEDEKPKKKCPVKETTAYDYVFVGAGIGNLFTASYLLQSAQAAGESVSAIMFEANEEVGGNIKAAKLHKPEGYDGSFGQELYGDQGPQRITQVTLPMERRDVHDQGLEKMFTPFKNDYNVRGRRKICRDPWTKAQLRRVDGEADGSSPALGFDQLFVFGDLCMQEQTDFVGENFVTGDDTANCSVYVGLHSPTCSNEAPSDAAIFWFLEGAEFKVAQDEPDIASGNYDYGALGSTHPLTCAECTVGVDCPWDLARTAPHEDVRTHFARILSTGEPGRPVLNYNYSTYIAHENVGFLGDHRRQFGAASYGDYTSREFNTNTFNGYIPGGMRRYGHSHWRNATDNGLETHLNEAVIRIDFINSGPYKFRVETTKRIVLVRRHAFLNLPPFYLQERESATDTPWVGRFLRGSLVEALREIDEFKHPDPQDVVRILAQWAPGEKPWFADLFAKDGNHSYRQFGDTGCFSRTEFIDTPYHRCTNHIVPVYTDDECERMWLGIYEEMKRTGDETYFKQRVVDEMKSSFPELAHKITPPVFVDFVYFPSAWHWGKRAYDNFENYEVTRKAANPFDGNGDWPVSLIGEAYAISWQGWMESALRTGKRALLQHAANIAGSDPALSAAIIARFDALFAVFPNPDLSVDDGLVGVFSYQPPLYTTPDPAFMLSTEHWPPYVTDYDDLYEAGPATVCSAFTYGLKAVNDQ